MYVKERSINELREDEGFISMQYMNWECDTSSEFWYLKACKSSQKTRSFTISNTKVSQKRREKPQKIDSCFSFRKWISIRKD